MLPDESITDLLNRLEIWRGTLRTHLNNVAIQGGLAQPGDQHGIRLARAEIHNIKKSLRKEGVPVEDEPQDTDEADTALVRVVGKAGVEQHQRSEPVEPDGRALIQLLGIGASVLSRLIARLPIDQAQQVNRAAENFRAHYNDACVALARLQAYKSIHELLHNVQTRCCDPIEQQVLQYFPSDLAVDQLESYTDNLDEIVAEIRDRIASSRHISVDTFWIDLLAHACDNLQQARTKLNERCLRVAVEDMRRVSARFPPEVNIKLSDDSNIKPLAVLIEQMTNISRVCHALNDDLPEIHEFDTIFSALNNLYQRLCEEVVCHGQLQSVDKLLRLIEGDGSNQEYIVAYWPNLKERAQPLFLSSDQRWVNALRVEEERLERAVATPEDVQLRQYFDSFRRCAGNWFARVDKRLLYVCDQLNQANGPLASAMRLIGD